MSAFDEIRAAIKAARPVAPDHDRVLFLGISARRAVAAEQMHAAEDGDWEALFGVLVREDAPFDGWALQDIGPEGRWLDVPAA